MQEVGGALLVALRLRSTHPLPGGRIQNRRKVDWIRPYSFYRYITPPLP
jgi:hypothetical protein